MKLDLNPSRDLTLDDALSPIWGVSDNMPFPPGVRDAEALIHPVMLTITQVRMLIQQQQKPWWKVAPLPGKKDLTFPTPGTAPYEDDVNAHLISLGLRMLNEAQRASEGPLTMEWLELSVSLGDRLYEYLWAEGADYVHHDGYEPVQGRMAEGLLLESRLERMADRAAAFALESWDEGYTRTRRERASKGGRRSKRPPEYSLAGIEHQTISEQMTALGCSRSTVMRLRSAAGR